ncbi:MAG: hypothetical protein NZ524_11325 [Thiobacillaceae bacterium]|nr:hypothetical protein [Thiobacillaceae bacterium]MCX7673015.1 hypothetical protein [Thiobacillaceae bacterium]
MSQKAAPTSAGAPGAGGAPEGLVIKTKSSPMAQQETPKIEERRAPEPATPMSVAMGKNALAPVTLNCRPGPLPANIGCPGSWVDLDPTPKTCWACIIHKPEPME